MDGEENIVPGDDIRLLLFMGGVSAKVGLDGEYGDPLIPPVLDIDLIIVVVGGVLIIIVVVVVVVVGDNESWIGP